MKRIAYVLMILFQALLSNVYAQGNPARHLLVGAYYFDGWTGKTSHVTPSLTQDYGNRKPIWGWLTSTPEIVGKQVAAAAEANIDFFSFCWYYSDLYKKNQEEPRNNALRLFLAAQDKHGLKFNLMVANHYGYTIGPADWAGLTKVWVDLFEKDTYLKFEEKPLITFLSLRLLVGAFGSAEKVKTALDQLRAAAVGRGLKGVNIAVCVAPNQKDADLARQCGFDLLTGYNYHDQTLVDRQSISPIKVLSPKEQAVWSSFLKFGMPYMPVATLNWDPRPWDEINKMKKASPHFEGYSPSSVYQSIKGLKKWTLENHPSGTAEQIAMIYAWNEYGEGAYLTPSVSYKNGLLEAVKEALK